MRDRKTLRPATFCQYDQNLQAENWVSDSGGFWEVRSFYHGRYGTTRKGIGSKEVIKPNSESLSRLRRLKLGSRLRRIFDVCAQSMRLSR